MVKNPLTTQPLTLFLSKCNQNRIVRHVHLLSLLTFIAVLFYQCRRDLGYIGSGDPGQVLIPNPVKANLQGNVLDESGQPAANVLIKAGTETAVTDNRG